MLNKNKRYKKMLPKPEIIANIYFVVGKIKTDSTNQPNQLQLLGVNLQIFSTDL